MDANFKPDYRPNVKCQIKFLKLILPYFTNDKRKKITRHNR